MKKAILLMFVSLAPLLAQNSGKISGHIVDSKSKEPLPMANIVIRGTTYGAASDIDGNYYILNLPPGTYDLTASIVGYRSVTKTGAIVNINRTTTVDFSLDETALQAAEVVITATRPDVEREKISTSEIRRGEDVLNVPGIQDISDVLTLSSDVSDGHFRGGRDNEELYNLHGMGIMNPLTSASAFNPIMSAVEEVEVITSGFGAQYGNAQSGVVNITMKEGSSDKWSARGEVRTRSPGRKHFGPSLWDTTGNPYLKLLDSPQHWMDSTNTASIGGITGLYGKDRITQSEVLYTLYLLQGHRDYLQDYGNLPDYSADVNFGGPLASNVRVFMALHVQRIWPMLPPPEPNTNQQFMGNVVYDFGRGMTLRVSAAFAKQEGHSFSGLSSSGWTSWVWDRVFGVTRTEDDNRQLGFRWAHALSASTFYEVKINTLQTKSLEGSPVTDPDYLAVQGLQKPFWISTWQPNPDGFSSFGKAAGTFTSEKTSTVSLDASITSQASSAHMLMAGIQGNWYSIDVNTQNGVDNSSGGTFSEYVAKPFEVGIYVQDKMEFQGMIASVGLRLDVYNPQVSYYTNTFAPFDYVDSLGAHHFEPLAPREQTSTVARLQPRAGFSFPVSVSTVFHVNYGTFLQRPTFNQILSETFSRLDVHNIGGASSVPQGQTLGNPRLKPEITNTYDIGVTQGLGEGFTLDVSGYYKDVKDLVQRALFYPTSSSNVPYLTYINREYARIRGFRVGLAKRRGMLTGTLGYTYGVASGKRSSANAYNYPTIYESGPSTEPLPQDILLDFDRTHNLIANFSFNTPENWGPAIFSVSPLERVAIAVTSFIRSGRPYSSWLKPGIPMSKRAPNETTTNVKITKNFSRFFGTTATFYVEIANLFNDRIYSYDAVFNPNPNNTANLQRFTVRYERGEDLTYYDNENYPAFLANQEFRIYSNAPRAWTIGMVVNF